VADLIGYESELNRIMSNFPQVNLCLYDLTRCSGDLIMDVLKTHPKALLGGMVIDNPYYLDPDEFLARPRLTLTAVGLPVPGEQGLLADHLRLDRPGHPGQVHEVPRVDVLGGDVARPTSRS
jgi:hypothetical protein